MELDFNPWSMLLSTIFGLLGLFFLRYGKAEGSFTKMVTGLLLMVYPLVVTGPWRNFLVGASLTAVPWLAGKMGIDF